MAFCKSCNKEIEDGKEYCDECKVKEEYLDNFTQQDLNWTMGYQGISFQFNPYMIAPYASGMQEVTVWFEEEPELFVESYTQVPEKGYVVSCSNSEKSLSDMGALTVTDTSISGFTKAYISPPNCWKALSSFRT